MDNLQVIDTRDEFLNAVRSYFRANGIGIVTILARNSAHVLRRRPVRSFEEVRELQAQFPRNDIGFWEGTEASDPVHVYYPEFEPRRR